MKLITGLVGSVKRLRLYGPVAVSKSTELVGDDTHERRSDSGAVNDIFDHSTDKQINVVCTHRNTSDA